MSLQQEQRSLSRRARLATRRLTSRQKLRQLSCTGNRAAVVEDNEATFDDELAPPLPLTASNSPAISSRGLLSRRPSQPQSASELRQVRRIRLDEPTNSDSACQINTLLVEKSVTSQASKRSEAPKTTASRSSHRQPTPWNRDRQHKTKAATDMARKHLAMKVELMSDIAQMQKSPQTSGLTCEKIDRVDTRGDDSVKHSAPQPLRVEAIDTYGDAMAKLGLEQQNEPYKTVNAANAASPNVNANHASNNSLFSRPADSAPDCVKPNDTTRAARLPSTTQDVWKLLAAVPEAAVSIPALDEPTETPVLDYTGIINAFTDAADEDTHARGDGDTDNVSVKSHASLSISADDVASSVFRHVGSLMVSKSREAMASPGLSHTGERQPLKTISQQSSFAENEDEAGYQEVIVRRIMSGFDDNGTRQRKVQFGNVSFFGENKKAKIKIGDLEDDTSVFDSVADTSCSTRNEPESFPSMLASHLVCAARLEDDSDCVSIDDASFDDFYPSEFDSDLYPTLARTLSDELTDIQSSWTQIRDDLTCFRMNDLSDMAKSIYCDSKTREDDPLCYCCH